jgi:hypothetical protein
MNNSDEISGYFGVVLFGLFVWLVFFDGWREVWYSRLGYAWAYDIPYNNVNFAKRPHDCDFMTAPLGEKHCHYSSTIVASYKVDKSSTGTKICSNDLGKTWTSDCWPGQTDYLTIEWNRVED